MHLWTPVQGHTVSPQKACTHSFLAVSAFLRSPEPTFDYGSCDVMLLSAYSDWLTASTSCTRQASREDSLWHNLFLGKFGNLVPDDGKVSWRALYR